MPRKSSLARTAVIQFISRAAASGAFCKEFEREKFDERFPRYYGQHAIRGTDRDVARTVMNCNDCLLGLDHLHDHLHQLEFIVGDCKNNDPYRRPYDHTIGMILGVLLLLASLGVGLLEGGRSWGAAAVGLVGAAWIFFEARYDGV